MCSLLTQPSFNWNQAKHTTGIKKPTMLMEQSPIKNAFIFLFVLSQLLQVSSYLGCLGQQRRIQQVISITTTTPFLCVCVFSAEISSLPCFNLWLFFFFYYALYISVKNNSGVKPAGQCGTWVKESEGGLFTSPNFPSKYPPNTECVYILEGKYALYAQQW